MNFHYLDVDDILATGELIQCTLESKVKGLGYLNPSTDDQNLLQGTKIELPFWLAQKLKNDSKHILSVTVPKVYSEAYRDMYKADAKVVDLQGLGPNFYNLAMKMSLIDPLQAREISASALQLYQGRFRSIMDSAQNATYKEKRACTAKFDNVELYLFKKGQASLVSVMKWEERETEKIVTSSVVKRHGKRKRGADDF